MAAVRDTRLAKPTVATMLVGSGGEVEYDWWAGIDGVWRRVPGEQATFIFVLFFVLPFCLSPRKYSVCRKQKNDPTIQQHSLQNAVVDKYPAAFSTELTET